MARKKNSTGTGKFHLEFLDTAQKFAWAGYQQHDVLFLTGPAGVGKTHLAMSFAINEVLQKKKSRIVLTRPIVEAGEKLGFLPGDFYEKVNPYMQPMLTIMDKLVGKEGPQRELIENAIDIVPIAFMRGYSFEHSVCIFDEAQNATKTQLKLFMSRFMETSKLIITGDPFQSDLTDGQADLVDVMARLETVTGIGMVKFNKQSIVRHPLVGKILERLEE